MVKYSLVARIFHWVIAVIVVCQIALGWIAENEKDAAKSLDLFAIHYRVGLLILALMALRFAWRLGKGAPPPPPNEPASRRRAARLVHALLYVILLSMPFSGYVIWSFMDAPMAVAGPISLPDLFPVMPEDETPRAAAWYVHVYSSRALVALIALHIGAALYHEAILRDGLIRKRML